MAHVSKIRLSESKEHEIKDKLIDLIRIVGKDRHTRQVLNEFITNTEGIMLAKRLAIIYLLNKEESVLDICDTLNVSSSTVLKAAKIYDRGGYQNLRKLFRRMEPTFGDIIETFLSANSNIRKKFHEKLTDDL